MYLTRDVLLAHDVIARLELSNHLRHCVRWVDHQRRPIISRKPASSTMMGLLLFLSTPRRSVCQPLLRSSNFLTRVCSTAHANCKWAM